MEYRTTVDNVERIIEVDSGIDLEPFIEVSSALVTQCCASAVDANGVGYTDTHLELIERWLAAHAYATRDPRFENEKAGTVSAKNQSAVDLGFNNSHYGQMALRLDYLGGLARLDEQSKKGKPTKASVRWVGTSKEELESNF